MVANRWYDLKEVKDKFRFGQKIRMIYSAGGGARLPENLGDMTYEDILNHYMIYSVAGYIVNPSYNDGSIKDGIRLGCTRLTREQFERDVSSEIIPNDVPVSGNQVCSIAGYVSVRAQVMFLDNYGVADEEAKKKYTKLVEKSVKKIKKQFNFMTKLKAVEIETRRSKGETYFKFEIAPEITSFFKDLSKDTIKPSESWKGLAFYISKSLQEDPYYKDKLAQYHLFDNYGGVLIDHGAKKFNIAWLRTVGGSGEIKMEDNVPTGTLTAYTKDVIAFLKDYLLDTFTETKIVGSVQFEV